MTDLHTIVEEVMRAEATGQPVRSIEELHAEALNKLPKPKEPKEPK